MSNKIKTILTLLLPCLFLVGIFGGCEKKNEGMKELENERVIIDETKAEENTEDEIESVQDLIDGEYQFEDVDTSNWKTYRNPKFNFEIKIPSEWKTANLENSKAGFYIETPTDEKIYVNSIINPQNLSIEERFEEFNDTSRFWFKKFKHEKFITSNHSGVHFPLIKEEGTITSRTEIYLKAERQIISFSYFFKERDVEFDQIFKKIARSIHIKY